MNSHSHCGTGLKQYFGRNPHRRRLPDSALPRAWLVQNMDVIATHHGLLKRILYVFRHLVRCTLHRKLAAVFYTDLRNYAGLTEHDEEETHRHLLIFLDIMSATIITNGGKIYHYAGDAILASFPRAADALNGAIVIQSKLDKLNRTLPVAKRLEFRIGLNFGEVITDRGDAFGNAVNIAVRLEKLAEPSGICVSDSIRANVGDLLPVNYVPLGAQRVKNISRPIEAFRIDVHPAPEQATPAIANMPGVQPRLQWSKG